MRLILFCFVTAAVSGLGQSLKRESVSSAGNSSSSAGLGVSQTIGQPYQTTTSKSDKTIFHPGFQQSIFRAELISATVEASILPNPALQSFFVVTTDTLYEGTITVFDEAGRMIYTENLAFLKRHEIQCAIWANGSYVLNIRDKKGNLVSARLIKHQ